MKRKSKPVPAPDESQITKSVLECRRAYHEMSDTAFATWYERRYGIPDKRVLAILAREGAAAQNGT